MTQVAPHIMASRGAPTLRPMDDSDKGGDDYLTVAPQHGFEDGVVVGRHRA